MPFDPMLEPEPDDLRLSPNFESLAASELPPERLAEIKRSFAARLKPVHPLPSDAALISIFVAVFLALALALTMPLNFNGFEHLTNMGRIIMYSAVSLSALVLATAVVEQLIPGSKRRIAPLAAIVLSLLIVGVMISFLFPDFTTERFIARGIPCLRLGTICAILGGLVTWLMMRVGFVTDPVPAALTTGAFSGLIGVGVLALHCDYQNATHILVWHLGVIVVSCIAGVVIAQVLRRATIRIPE